MIRFRNLAIPVFILLTSLITFSSIGQPLNGGITPEQYRAVHWGLKDGLSQACVLQMRQDMNGFLWMGTQGELSRFDGSVFKNYYHDPKKSGTIDASFTHLGLVEDSLHNIWIGTDKGLYRYDMKADTFSHLLPAAPLCASSNELFCTELPGSIISFNIHTFTKKTVATLIPTDSIGLGLNIFSTFSDEQTNSLWMLRSRSDNSGWHGSGLMQLSLTDGRKKYYNWNCYKNIPGHDHSAEAMCYDRKRNCLWINSAEGLMQFTLDDHQFHYIGALNSFFYAKDYSRWVGICMDLQGRVWLATRPKGVVIYDPSDQSVTFPFTDGSALQKEISENNGILYCDEGGIIWSGFWLPKGIYQIIPFSPSFTHYKPNTAINSFNIGSIFNFQNAGNGKLWIGSTDGIHRIFDTRTGTIQTLSDNDLPPELRKTAFLPVLIDTTAQKAYLFCFAKGIWVLDMNTNKCQPFNFKNGANHEVFPSNQLGFSLFKDGFVGCGIQDNRQSIFFVNGENRIVQEMFSFPVDPDNRFVLELADDRFIFFRRSDQTGKQNLTYVYQNNTWVQRSNPLDSIPYSHIIHDKKDQGYWVVAEKELIHYNKDFRIVRAYSAKDGLPELDIQSLLPDSKGNIWFKTDRSIHQLNIETDVFSTLSEKDGFQPQNFGGGAALYMGADGNLYLGGGTDDEGFVRISPDKYSNTSSSVYLKSVEINQRPFPLSTGVNSLQQLDLLYFQNKITIETGIIDYYSKGSNHIRYKLETEGKNEDWQYAPSYYTIRYENLPPGKYTLMMQSSNAANEFIGPVKTMDIHISPPWWKTWWAYLIYIPTFIALTWSFIQYRSRNLLERNKVLETKVMDRTTELKLSLDELKETQSQLIQQEKMASLGELTAGIAHEIQNPLNFMNNFSEVNAELITELKKELAIGNEQLAKGEIGDTINYLKNAIDVSNDIESNSVKINHHGKRADAIVKGMLQHSRKSTGQKEFTDVNALVDEYLRLSYHACLAGKQGVQVKDNTFNVVLKTDLDETLPKINIIPQDIGRVLLNVFNNAFYAVYQKYLNSDSREFTPLVTVVTQKTKNKSGGNQVEIHIKDNGSGIPQKMLDKIFQPFFTTKPTGQGIGLGLYLAYDIIKTHSGTIEVKSHNGTADDSTSVVSNIHEPGSIPVNSTSIPDIKRQADNQDDEFAEFIIILPV